MQRWLAAMVAALPGAFRFTPGALAQVRRRELDVTVRSVTAGIRGADLWGKAPEGLDIVCLIEGRIEVRRVGTASFTMTEQRSFFVVPREGRAPPATGPRSARRVRRRPVATSW